MTLVEVMVAALLTLTISGAAFSLALPAHGLVQAQPEASDMQQRSRVVAETLRRAIMSATDARPQGASGITLIAPDGPTTYYLQPGNNTATLRRARAGSDFPVVDDVVGLAFEYFADSDGAVQRVRIVARVQATPASLRGRAGPLFVYGGTSTSAERWLPDREVQFDVTLRNR